eukprot:767993-Hanusia_phi.AAC.3
MADIRRRQRCSGEEGGRAAMSFHLSPPSSFSSPEHVVSSRSSAALSSGCHVTDSPCSICLDSDSAYSLDSSWRDLIVSFRVPKVLPSALRYVPPVMNSGKSVRSFSCVRALAKRANLNWLRSHTPFVLACILIFLSQNSVSCLHLRHDASVFTAFVTHGPRLGRVTRTLATSPMRRRHGVCSSLQVRSALDMYRPAELILKEVKNVDGVDINIKLEGLGGNRRRISGGLFIEAPPRAIWDVLTNYNNLHEYIPNIAESGESVLSCATAQRQGPDRTGWSHIPDAEDNDEDRLGGHGGAVPAAQVLQGGVSGVHRVRGDLLHHELQGWEVRAGTAGAAMQGEVLSRAYLEYSVEALPLPILPIQLVQGKIKKEVPPMLAAVRTNANKYHSLRCRTLGPNWMDDVPVPTSTSYRKRLSSTNSIADDRPSYTAPGIESTKLYTIERAPSLPFTSLASGLLQAAHI